MQKSDLKPGMVVKIGNNYYMYLIASEPIFLGNGFISLDRYKENLEYSTLSAFDITEIYKGCSEVAMFGSGLESAIKKAIKEPPIWKKPTLVTLTMEQIAEKFNIPVESLRIKN